MRDELKRFNINLDDIEENCNIYEQIEDAIEKMHEYGYKDLEVLLNKNLLVVKRVDSGEMTIFGLKVSLENLNKDISFVVIPRRKEKTDYKQMYFELKETLKELVK